MVQGCQDKLYGATSRVQGSLRFRINIVIVSKGRVERRDSAHHT